MFIALFSRIDKLDFALRSLQAQHQVSETENIKRSSLLEHTTSALSLLENENCRLKKVSMSVCNVLNRALKYRLWLVFNNFTNR